MSKTEIYNLLGTSNNTRHLCVVGVRIPTEHPCHEKEYNTLCLTYNARVQYYLFLHGCGHTALHKADREVKEHATDYPECSGY